MQTVVANHDKMQCTKLSRLTYIWCRNGFIATSHLTWSVLTQEKQLQGPYHDSSNGKVHPWESERKKTGHDKYETYFVPVHLSCLYFRKEKTIDVPIINRKEGYGRVVHKRYAQNLFIVWLQWFHHDEVRERDVVPWTMVEVGVGSAYFVHEDHQSDR